MYTMEKEELKDRGLNSLPDDRLDITIMKVNTEFQQLPTIA